MINLTKGQKINLTKEDNTSLTRINVGLGWDEVKRGLFSTFKQDIDCDASCVLLGENGQMISPYTNNSVIYFHNRVLPGIRHSGDNLTGGAVGDDETIEFNLPEIESKVDKIVIFMNIYHGAERKQDLSSLKNAYIRVYNPLDRNKELCRFALDEYKKNAHGLIAAEIYRKDNVWKFGAIGEPVEHAECPSDVVRSIVK